MKRFQDLVVVELAGSIAGAYAGKLFADFGATVVKVEPPGGDPLRGSGERMPSGDGTVFSYLNTGKQSTVVDSDSPAGRELLAKLAMRADVLIESASPGPLDPVCARMDGLGGTVRVCISPFGLDGPYSGYRSTPFTDFAAGGHMYLTGEPDREPLQGAGPQALYAAGTFGFIGAMAALLAREESGRRQLIDVSHMEVMASVHQWTTVRYTHGGVIQRRVGNKYGSLHPSTLLECKDGWVAFAPVGNDPLGRFLAVIGMDHLLQEPRFSTGAMRFENADAFDDALRPWMMEHTLDEIVTLAQDVRAPVAAVKSLSQLLTDPHLIARSFWRTAEGDDSGLKYPGPPFRMSGHEWRLEAAPELAQGDALASATAEDTQ